MQPDLIQYIAMALDYFSAFILILISVCCVMENNKTRLLKIYIYMAVPCIVALLLEATAYVVTLVFIDQGDTLRLVLSHIAIACGYVLSFFYACYVSNLIGFESKICRIALKILAIIGIVSTCFLTLGLFFDMFFTIKNGEFTPEKYFVFAFGFDIIACLTGIFLIIKYRKKLNQRDIIALLSLPTFIFISAVLQYTSFNIMFGLFLMAAASLIIIYLMIQTDQNRQKAEQEKQLTDMNVAIMLSQIQPHFLYNTLSSIRRMIKKDPETAEKAIENFSLYLRQNFESMNQIEPILFSTELKHVKEYLYLEKLRFGERLKVEYDISYSEFMLPVLTLQPIVENAVKHGILKKEEGGCIKIKSRLEGKHIVLTVEDDGIGFFSNRITNDDRTHIGFHNVKSRIEMQCNGSVEVKSAVDKGTSVIIKIPVE